MCGKNIVAPKVKKDTRPICAEVIFHTLFKYRATRACSCISSNHAVYCMKIGKLQKPNAKKKEIEAIIPNSCSPYKTPGAFPCDFD